MIIILFLVSSFFNLVSVYKSKGTKLSHTDKIISRKGLFTSRKGCKIAKPFPRITRIYTNLFFLRL